MDVNEELVFVKISKTNSGGWGGGVGSGGGVGFFFFFFFFWGGGGGVRVDVNGELKFLGKLGGGGREGGVRWGDRFVWGSGWM